MTVDLFNLKDKTAIVTGGAGLLGESMCRALHEYGANVAIADVDKEASSELEDELGDGCKFVKTDITSEKSIESTIEDVEENFGTVDILVNNAYPRNEKYGCKYEDITLESWKENIDLHLNGYFNITKKVSERMMEEENGVIINIGSIYGIQAPDFDIYENLEMTSPAEYSAVKGGILNFTRYLASYLSDYNIRVNSISPGGVFNDQKEEFVENYEDKVPLGRMGEPEDIQGAIVFLASDASSYVTGHNLVVDGGWTIK